LSARCGLRALLTARRSAVNAGTAAINQIHALLITAPPSCANATAATAPPGWLKPWPDAGPGSSVSRR